MTIGCLLKPGACHRTSCEGVQLCFYVTEGVIHEVHPGLNELFNSRSKSSFFLMKWFKCLSLCATKQNRQHIGHSNITNYYSCLKSCPLNDRVNGLMVLDTLQRSLSSEKLADEAFKKCTQSCVATFNLGGQVGSFIIVM